MTRLKVVQDDDTAKRRVYVIATDTADFEHTVADLDETEKFVIINGDEDRLVDEVDLRVHIQALSVSDDLCLPIDWWTSTTAHQLVTIGGWLRIRFIDRDGTKIPTASLRGSRA